MIPDISYFKEIHNATGTQNAKEAKIIAIKTRLSRDFDSSIHVVYDATRNGIPQDFIIVPTDDGCNLFSRPGEEFFVGDIIYFNGLHWLIVEKKYQNELSPSGELIKCNKQIRWQNKSTYKTIERWCVFSSTPSFKIDENSSLSTSDKEYKLQLPYDEETKLLDLGMRIMPDIINGKPRTYKCTGIDQNTKAYQGIDGGLIIFRFTQDGAQQPNDRADLMVCDYEDPPDNPAPSPTLLRCVIDGRNIIRVGIGRKYTATFFAEDGTTVVNDIKPSWTVTAPVGYESKVTWTQNDGSIEMTVTDEALIGQAIVVGLADIDGLYSSVALRVEVVDII